MSSEEAKSLPPEVGDVLQTSEIGYLSVTSPKGELYSYPVAFYFTGENVYLATPVSSAKLKFIKANPKVSLIVDNRRLTLEACGAMVQGDATIYGIRQMLSSVLSVGPAAVRFSKKYPRMFAFYAKGKDLPDDRKLYKYRFIRISPTKIVFWVGYKFGKYLPKKEPGGLRRLFSDLKGGERRETVLQRVAEILESGDEGPTLEEAPSLDEAWIKRLYESSSKGGVSEEERKVLQSFAKVPAGGSGRLPDLSAGPRVLDEEKSILKKWRTSSR